MMTPDPKQKIRLEAYYIWEREGRPEGKALDHWVAAEQAPAPPNGQELEGPDLEGKVGTWSAQPSPEAAAPKPRRASKSPTDKPPAKPRAKRQPNA